MSQLTECLPAPFRTPEIDSLMCEWDLEPVCPYWGDMRKGVCDIAQHKAYLRYEDMKEALWRDSLVYFSLSDFDKPPIGFQFSLF